MQLLGQLPSLIFFPLDQILNSQNKKEGKERRAGHGEEKGRGSTGLPQLKATVKPSLKSHHSKAQQSAINSLLTAGNRLSFTGRLNRFVD